MKNLNCLIVDDEELARKLIALYIEKTEGLSLIAMTKNAVDALSLIEKDSIDLVFLDIQMPELSGIQLAKLLPGHIKIIFTSGYPKDILEDTYTTAVDYLVKPITLKRFQEAVYKIKEVELNKN